MNNRLSAWWTRRPADQASSTLKDEKVVQLRPSVDSGPRGSPDVAEQMVPAQSGPAAVPAVALMDDSGIQEFLRENWFGLGRHNGAVFRTRESLDRGRSSVIARFQNTIEGLAARREAQIRRLQDTLIEIEGISETTSRRLDQAVQCMQQDVVKLRAEIAHSTRAEGWVKEAVLSYEAGFAKGLYEAVAVEMHGGLK